MEMTIKETLKINDELSIELDVIYENGEKYIDIAHLSQIHLPSTGNRDLNEIINHCYSPIWSYSDLVGREYANALSIEINREPAFIALYDDEAEEPFNLWKLWNEMKWKKIINTRWEYRYPQDQINGNWYNLGKCMNEQNEDILFPLIIMEGNIEGWKYDSKEFIHFDVFLFLLYLKYPQYKNDIMRFLKYQPVCTMESDQLYIHNLKQTNKDLLKQLNEMNHRLPHLEKERDVLINERNELKKQLDEQNEELSDSKNRILELTHANEELVKELDVLKKKLSSSEDSLRHTSEELTTTNQRMRATVEECELLKAKADKLESELTNLKSALKKLISIKT